MILSDLVKKKAPGLGSGPPKWVGPGSGVATSLVVSESRFRRFWKKALNDFKKGFLK